MTAHPSVRPARFSSRASSSSALLLVGLLTLITGLAAPVPVSAEICAVDDAPAATLLLPYFEVDTTSSDGITTLFSVVNTVAEPTLVKMTLWSDLGIPVVDVDFYLTGFDVATFNLRDLLVHGMLPVTGHEASNTGADSFPSFPFPGCDSTYGDVFGGSIPEGARQGLVDFLSGRPSVLIGGLCGATPKDSSIVTGYATFDVVDRCELIFPTDPGYFGPGGVASNDNRLIGDAFYVFPGQDFAQGINLVRLEADPERFGPGDRTFYGPYLDGDGSDAREPLPTVWAARNLDGGGFSGGTGITVWRSASDTPEAFNCAGPTPILPLISEVFSFDEEENGFRVYPNTAIIDPPPPLEDIAPFTAAVSQLDSQNFPVFNPSPFGWMLFDLGVLAFHHGSVDPFAQGWVGTIIRADGRYSVGQAASPLSDACSTDGCTLGDPFPAGELCIFGAPDPTNPDVTVINANGFVEFELRPAGCFSSSCSVLHRASCSLERSGSDIFLESTFCLSQDMQPGAVCTPDCGPGYRTDCTLFGGLPEGSYTVQVDGLSLTFDVPSTVPITGLCTGSAF